MQQVFDPVFVRKFRRHQWIGQFLAGRPGIYRAITRIGQMFASVENDVARFNKRFNGTAVSYDDLAAAVDYAREVDLGLKEDTEGAALYREELKTLRSMMPTPMFNFGICYAYVDSVLARENPSAAFTGIDLSEKVKAFNESAFPDIPNLTFHAGDVFTHLEANRYPGAIFFHSRTLVLLPKAFIEKLYAAVAKAGFKCIVGFEQNGLSEETGEPFSFDVTDRPSVYWRDRMYLHNYPALAEKAGFHVKSMDLFETGHTSPDFRVLRFIAEA